jgi:hypothetical protein
MKIKASSVFLSMAVSGFCLSLLAHVLTFWGISPLQRFPVGCLLVVALGLALLPPLRRTWLKEDANHPESTAFPWAVLLMLGFILYIIFTGYYVNVLDEWGNPHEVNGKYYLMTHGSVIRELTEQEYQQHLANLPRLLSSILLLYYFMGMLLFHRESKESGA